MRKCRKKSNFGECPACPFVKQTEVVKSTQSNYCVEVNTAVDCQTTGDCITSAKYSQTILELLKKVSNTDLVVIKVMSETETYHNQLEDTSQQTAILLQT